MQRESVPTFFFCAARFVMLLGFTKKQRLFFALLLVFAVKFYKECVSFWRFMLRASDCASDCDFAFSTN
jgi:hypothetical protein